MLGVDLDGFMWARRRALPFVASLKGIIADELRNERGWVRVLLSVQARWERRNVERADLVVVTSRYSAEVAQREYGVPARAHRGGAGADRPRGLGRPVLARSAAAPRRAGGPVRGPHVPAQAPRRSPARRGDPARASGRDPGAHRRTRPGVGRPLAPPRGAGPGRGGRAPGRPDPRAPGRGVRERLRVLPAVGAGGLRHRVPGGDGRRAAGGGLPDRRGARGGAPRRRPGSWWRRAIRARSRRRSSG